LPSSFLERLREQSEAARAADAAAKQPLASAREDLSRRLWQTFRWLDEAVGYLGVIRPPVKRRFRLTDTLSFAQPQFDQGYVAFRRKGLHDSEVLDHIELQYRLLGAEKLVARVPIAGVSQLEERLRSALLKYDYESEQDHKQVIRYGVFRIEPAINASVRFRPDYMRGIINVTLHNVDRFESLRLEFGPAALGESALEDLVRCVLGESDRFLHLAPVALGTRREAGSGALPRDGRAPDPSDAPRGGASTGTSPDTGGSAP